MRPYEKNLKEREKSELAPIEKEELLKIGQLEKALKNFKENITLEGTGVAYAWISNQVTGPVLKIQPFEKAHIRKYHLPQKSTRTGGMQLISPFHIITLIISFSLNKILILCQINYTSHSQKSLYRIFMYFSHAR